MKTKAVAELALLAAGRAGLLGASVVSVHTATRVLGPHEMGAMNLVLAAIGLVALLVAGCSHFFYRQAMAWQLDGSLPTNLRRYAVFLLCAGAGAALVALLLPARWLPAPALWFAALLAGNLVIATLQQALLHLVNLLGQRSAYVVLANGVAWGGVALASAATAEPGAQGAQGAQAAHWLAGLLGAQAIGLAAAALWLLRSAPAVPATATATATAASETSRHAAPAFAPRAVAAFAAPLVLCMGLYWVQRSLPLPWLAAAAGVQAVGLYSVAYSVGMLAMLSFDSLFKEVYAPRYERAIAQAVAQAAAPARVAAWEAYATAFLPAALAACVCTAAAGPALLQAVTAPPFHTMGAFVAWGAVSQWLLSCYSLVMLQSASAMDNRALVLPNVAGAVLTAALLQMPLQTPLQTSLQTPFQPLGAMTQAALATTVGLLVTTGLAAWRVRRVHAARWPGRRLLLAGLAASPAWALANVGPPAATLAALLVYAVLLQAWLARGWLGTLPPAGVASAPAPGAA